jgi:CRP/FNR family transcriptional regulator
MPTGTLIEELRRCYPSLRGLAQTQLATDVERAVRLLEVESGTRLFEAGQPCAGFPLVLGGEIQVARSSSDGRSLELYRVVQGQVCIVSTASLVAQRPLTAQGTTTLDTRLALVAPEVFERWNNHLPFRQFVFGVFAERLADLMAVVDAVAFRRLDQRLADYLLGHGRNLHATHQHVADELGTVREMVTRLLNRFELMGVVKLGRERIEIVDVVGLRAVASGQGAAR